jgi:putative NADH-flavin reductase
VVHINQAKITCSLIKEGRSYISMEDYSVAVLDEIEQSMHLKERFTVASV